MSGTKPKTEDWCLPMTDLDFPGCSAADEYGHPIMCEDCIWGETCIDSTVREDNDGTEEL